MKIVGYLLILTAFAAVFGSCQKELNFDNSDSVGTLKSAVSGDCLPVTVNGIYRVDSTLSNENYVDVQVDVSIPGNFNIKSDTINGYSFSKTGAVIPGLNTIRLYPSGKPVAAGINIFTIRYGNSSCTFSINVVPSNVGGAIYNLGGAPNACSSFTPHGVYTAGTPMVSEDSVVFNVNVQVIGTYSITTTSNNGISFSASGSFTNTGIQLVSIHAIGTPAISGTFPYTVSGGGTTCTFNLTTLAAGSGNATYTLNGDPGTCSGVGVYGTYTAGTPVNAGDSVSVSATVITPGAFTITTATSNGISFSKSGTFTGTSFQRVILTAQGTPTNPTTGTGTVFTASGNGTTSCLFAVSVAPGTTPNLEYVPETAYSNWSAALVGGTPADTTYTQVSPNTIVKNGVTYKIFEGKILGVPSDSAYRRKNLGQYFQLINTDFGVLATPFNTEVMMLDSTKNVAYNWETSLGPNDVPILSIHFIDIKVSATITAKGASATIGTTNFTNVFKVQYVYLGDQGTGYIPVASGEVWYAKGVGIIYNKQTDPFGTVTEYNTTRYTVY